MILRRRHPLHPPADIDLGPSSAISHRTAAEAASGAVLPAYAVKPDLPKGTVTPQRKREDYFRRRRE